MAFADVEELDVGSQFDLATPVISPPRRASRPTVLHALQQV